MEIAQQVHSLRASFGPQLGVQLLGSSQLVGRRLGNSGTERRNLYWSHVGTLHFFKEENGKPGNEMNAHTLLMNSV